MKKTLVALFTMVALSIGVQSFAACPCSSSSYGHYGYNMASPCGCPIAKPCCPVVSPACPVVSPCGCQSNCNSCCNTGCACNCNNGCGCGCNNCCREKCSWWKIFQNKNCCYRCNKCCDCCD